MNESKATSVTNDKSQTARMHSLQRCALCTESWSVERKTNLTAVRKYGNFVGKESALHNDQSLFEYV